MASITTWTRLEPAVIADDLAAGYAATLQDPLWLLGRQWQTAELRGHDGGTPIVARWRGRVASMTRWVPGVLAADTQTVAARLDDSTPLAVRVQGQQLTQSRTVDGLDGLRLAVDSGLHLLRLLRAQALSVDVGPALLRAYAVPPVTEEQRAALDPEALGYADLVAGSALDGRRVRAAVGEAGDPVVDPALGVPAGDVAEVREALRAWRTWTDGLFGSPTEPTWQPDRFEHAFALSTRLGEDVFSERTLTAAPYEDGTLDWYAFDLRADVNLGTSQDAPAPVLTRTALPAPVTLPGVPSARFWEVEDPRLDLDALTPGATDLAQLLLVETLAGYGNDWFVLPVELPVGSLSETLSLVVTDTFGAKTLLQPTRKDAGWSAFSLSYQGGGTEANLFHLPATLVSPLEGAVLEEVLLARDEVADIAWAVERRLESPLEVGVETTRFLVDPPPGGAAPPDVPIYRLATPVAPHWIPLLPVRLSSTSAEVRLVRGALLDLEGGTHVVTAQARLLDALDPTARLELPEEEVPREGVVLRRAYRAARWSDGSLHVWAAHRATVGRGEASSGLAFDALER